MKTFNFKKIFPILTITLFFVGGAAFAVYTPASCTAPGCNTKPPVTDGSAVDHKVGAITFGSNNAPTSGVLADIYGVLSAKLNPVVSFANTTVGGVYQTGSLNIDKLRNSSIAGACADPSGNIVSCAVPSGATNAPIYFTNPNTNGTSYTTTWTVPSGTNLIKVEMWGGGGAGTPSTVGFRGGDGSYSALKKVGDSNNTMQAGGGLGGPYSIGTNVFSAGQYIANGQMGEFDSSKINCYGGKGGSSYKIDGTVYGAGGNGGTFSAYSAAATITDGQDGSGYGSGGGGPGSLNCSTPPGFGGTAGSYAMSIIQIPTSGTTTYQITVGAGSVNTINGGNYYLAHDYHAGNGANGVVIITPNP